MDDSRFGTITFLYLFMNVDTRYSQNFPLVMIRRKSGLSGLPGCTNTHTHTHTHTRAHTQNVCKYIMILQKLNFAMIHNIVKFIFVKNKHSIIYQYFPLLGNGEMDYHENIYCLHKPSVENNGDINVSESKLSHEDKKANGNGVLHDNVDTEKVACETIDNSADKHKGEYIDATSENGDNENGNEECKEGDGKAQTPIQLTITKRSLRQRNRGCHTTPPVEPAGDSSLLTHSNPSEDIKCLFSDLAMTIKLLEGHFQGVCSVDMNGDYVVSGG